MTEPQDDTPALAETDPRKLIRIARAGEDARSLTHINLGDRVRALRKAQGWTLEQAARQAGLARSTLSKIENGQMSPTYDGLKKLATGLRIPIPQLFTPPEKAEVTGRMAVTKAGDGESHVTATYEHDLLAGALSRRDAALSSGSVPARWTSSMAGSAMMVKFLYVLTGIIQLYTEFYAPVELPGRQRLL